MAPLETHLDPSRHHQLHDLDHFGLMMMMMTLQLLHELIDLL
jgi:hypothetical protein